MAAVPKVNFFCQVGVGTDERRRRIQARTGWAMPRLVDEALAALELSLSGCKEGSAEGVAPHD